MLVENRMKMIEHEFYLQLWWYTKMCTKQVEMNENIVFFSKPKGWTENTMRLENANHSSATSHCPAP